MRFLRCRLIPATALISCASAIVFTDFVLVRVGDVEHTVAADGEASGMAHGLGTSTYPTEPVSTSMRITRHGPRRTLRLSLR
jgi:hypothetical protein